MIPAARMRPKARTALLAAALSGLAALAAIPPAAADRDHLRGPADPVAVQATQADSIRYSIRVTDDNLMGITITNYGFVGNNFTSRSPSLEYPLGSGFEHMVRGETNADIAWKLLQVMAKRLREAEQQHA